MATVTAHSFLVYTLAKISSNNSFSSRLHYILLEPNASPKSEKLLLLDIFVLF
jgi:hypothetical protein